jgi:hexosaminidase
MLLRWRVTAVVFAVLPLLGASAADLSLVPWPRALTRTDGSFRISAATPIVCHWTNGDGCAFAAKSLSASLARSRGLTLARDDRASDPAIVLRHSETPVGEGYRLTVTPAGIEIAASTDGGLYYGTVTLLQLATTEVGAAQQIDVPGVTIDDAPRYAWRGLMLDSVRHFQSPATVKALIDAMALHKLNMLHWHLVDDQGWRIEIRKYPRLTRIGAFRSNRRERHYGGYYTKRQIRDIVAYARARNITIVPEIEMPGHALAPIAAYPRLGSVKRIPQGPTGDWGIFPYLYNVDDATFAFLEDVLSEVMALFPSPYIHIGGDEAPKDQWNASPGVQKRMRTLGIADTRVLQGYFTNRIGRFLLAHGRRPIGWDEVLEGHPSPDVVVMSWRAVDSASEAADRGHDVVLSSAPRYYLDYCQAERAGEPPCRGPQATLRDVYAFDPSANSALDKHLLGVQANIWTEHLPTAPAVFYAAFPRAAAVAETGWSSQRDWPGFLSRLPALFERYRTLGIGYSDVIFAVDAATEKTASGVKINLANQAGFGTIRYTLDGAVPTVASPAFTAPFGVTLPVTLSAATFVDGKQVGRITRERLDVRSILRRTSWTMDQCSNDLPLAQKTRDGKVAMVNVMNPCWIYRAADLGTWRGFETSVAPLPFNFSILQDIKKIPLFPHAVPGGQLEVRQDSCTGPLLAVAKLPKTRGSRTLRVALPSGVGVHDLCLLFARRIVDPVWAIDWVQPLLKE